ncbi:MAG: N-acetylglucosamine kinase [Candidatus Abyssubacteria bacterium]
MSDKEVILAVDGGGTATRCLAIDHEGTVCGEGKGGPSNHILAPWDVVRQSLESALHGALSTGRLSLADVCCVSLGTAGIGPSGEGKEWIEDLVREIVPAPTICATGDMVIAFHGAIMESHGVIANAGTGSVVYGVSPSGASRQVGGWGHILGDEGSAYDIALRGLRAGARHFDGRAPFTTLVDRMPEALDVSDYIQLAFKIYGLNMARDELATLAKVVAAAARAGDAISRDILRRAGEELALAVLVAIRELGMDDMPLTVSYMGSVFDSGELIVRPFAEAVLMERPLARVLPPKFPAVIGAFILGAQRAGWHEMNRLLANIKRCLLARGNMPGHTLR